MDQKHFVIKLKANSPYVGQICPVRRTVLQPGEDVLVCQHHQAAVALSSWHEVENDRQGRCFYCNQSIRHPDKQRWVVPVLVVSGIVLLALGVGAGLLISGILSPDEELSSATLIVTPTIKTELDNPLNQDYEDKDPSPTTISTNATIPANNPAFIDDSAENGKLPASNPPHPPALSSLLQDNFNKDSGQWQLSTSDNVRQLVNDGRLILQLNPDPKAIAWTNIDDTFQNFVMEVDTQYKQGSADHVYGLIARQKDNENFYQFALRQNMFNVYKYDNGEWVKIQGQTPSAAIKPPGETNHLKLIAVDSRFQFFANDKLLADIQDETFREGGIGLLAAVFEPGEAQVTFDNVVIKQADEKTLVDEKPESVPAAVVAVHQLAFTKYENGSHNLYIADTNGNNQQLIFTRAAGPSFSPDKTRLFFYGEAGTDQQYREGNIACEFRTISDGIVAVDLPSPPRDICQIQFGPWFCDRKGVDLQTEPSDVCTANGVSVYQNLDWKEGTARWASASPDNYAVAFDAKPGSERRIYFRSMLGANQSFRFELVGEQGAWSPNGQQMVYRSGRDNKTGLWISNRDDTGHTNLTINGTDSFPTWSPAGRTIVFSREIDGNWDIYTINSDGSNLQRLTDAPGHDILPVYSPSGEIIFRSARTGSWGIWKMSGNGTGQREIISKADVGPDWTSSRMDVK